MTTRGFSAYNLARGALLNSKLTLADSGNQPLKLLDIVVSGIGMDPTSGLWLTPLHAIPAVPRVFPFDLIYLDKEYRVLDIAEMGPGIEFPAFHPQAASALVLPSDTLRRTQTQSGDHLIVCPCSDLEALLAPSSLSAVDAAEPARKPVVAAALPVGKAHESTVIELKPDIPVASRSVTETPFDQTVLTAVAKVAETREGLEPKPVTTTRDLAAPGPSLSISEAVFNPAREVQPTIIEHRIDPEDLFSNWVVTAPPEPQKVRVPPELTAPKKLEPAKETPAPNNRKSTVVAKPPAEASSQSRTGSASRKGQPRIKAAAVPPERPATSVPPKTSAPENKDTPKKARPPVSPLPPATTVTAVPYGMWQISMPTAVARMAGSSTAAASSAKQQAPSPEPKAQAAPPNPAPKPQPRQEPVSTSENRPVSPAPVPGKRSDAMPPIPGDFVASLQEKLKRVQESKPLAAPAPVKTAALAAPAPAPVKTAALAAPAPALVPPVEPDASTIPAPPIATPEGPKPAVPVAASSAAVPKLKPASPPQARPKTEPALGGFRSKLKNWLNPTTSPSDRRRATRRYVPGMVAHYFTGGAPKPHNIADISMSGMYLLTDDRWMPGTMIQMTLQKPCAHGEKKQSINVLSRIVRRASDGVAAEFIMPEALSHTGHDIQPSQATDKFALARFL